MGSGVRFSRSPWATQRARSACSACSSGIYSSWWFWTRAAGLAINMARAASFRVSTSCPAQGRSLSAGMVVGGAWPFGGKETSSPLGSTVETSEIPGVTAWPSSLITVFSGLWVPKTCRNHTPAGWRLCHHAARRLLW